MESLYTFFIGPRKTGTTSFYNICLTQNLRISTRIKETFFFESEKVELSEYERRFGINAYEPFWEISPSYFTNSFALSNIERLFPDARIVITLRDPVHRAMSALNHLQQIGLIKHTADKRNLLENKHVQNIIATNNYEKYITLWAAAFPGKVIQIKQGADTYYDAEAITALNNFLGTDIFKDMQKQRSGRARTARSVKIVQVTRSIQKKLKDVNAFGLINALKVFKPLLYKKNNPKPVQSDEVMREIFSEQLQTNIFFYENEPMVRIL